MRDVIHFAHGNGFPSSCYRQVLKGLEPDFGIKMIEMLGHDVRFPVTENWHHLVDEVIHSIESQAREPVIGVGHSLGGVLTALACIEKPDYFKGVVLLDSPMIGSVKSSLVRLAKRLGIIDRVTPAQRTRGRRKYWQDRQKLHHYLQARSLFKRFDDKCLNDYIDFGLQRETDGYYLRFDRHVEYLIYRTLPHQLPQYHGRLMRPAVLIYGEDSDIVDAHDIRNMKRHYEMTAMKTLGGHMFPLEYPVETASMVKEAISLFN